MFSFNQHVSLQAESMRLDEERTESVLAPISFEHDEVHVSGDNPGVFHNPVLFGVSGLAYFIWGSGEGKNALSLYFLN